MQALADILRQLIPPTRKLLLYNNWSNTKDFEMCLNITGLTIDKLLETKCSTTRDALSYLLNFDPVGTQNLDKAIIITLQGYVGEEPSDTGHVLTIIPNNGMFLVIDSYYSCRGLVITIVDEKFVLSLLTKLADLTAQFMPSLWYDITNCPYVFDATDIITVEISYNDFNLDGVKQHFHELVLEVISKIQDAQKLENEYTLDEILRDRKRRFVYNNLSDDKIMYLQSEDIQSIEEVVEWLQSLLLY